MRLLLILAALAAPHSTVDQTWSCPVLPEGAAHVMEARASVTTPRDSAYLQFWPTERSYFQPAVQAGVEVGTHPGTIAWDPRHVCERSPPPLAFAARGLKQDAVVTTHFVGSVSARCRVPSRIRFRVRVTVVRDEPTSAKLIVVTERRAQPVLYVEWTPTRIAVWDRPGCST
jgi:hypothetical protein